MNLGLISLILLLVAIIIGFWRNCNVGILCIGFSMILSIAYGISTKEVIAGFSSSLFIQMVGITYLFSIINANGTLELLARKMVALVGTKKRLIPFVMYILGFAICAVGPGAIPSLAIVPVIAIPVAVSAGINPIMTAIIGDLGVMSGRMSPLTPESAVVRELMEEQGLTGNTIPIMFGMIVTALVTGVLVYIYYKGWKIDESSSVLSIKELPKFNVKQWCSLVGLLVLAVGALFFSWNVGLTGFLVGTILVVIGDGQEKKAIAGIPWNVILMVLGVGILMNIVSISGGIDIMVAGLEKIMGQHTATMIMAIASGFMSFFSSGLGVVFPTLIPTASGLGTALGVNAVQLVTVIVIGGTVSGFTPISTTGALIMAGVAQQENAEERFPQNKLFVELFAVSFIALAVLAIFAVLGVYGLFV